MRRLNAAIFAELLRSATGLVASAEELTVANAPPVVVNTEPRAGQTDVAPSTSAIRVTFSRPMRNGSWSWVKLSDASFPKTTGNPRFLDDQRTCVLPVSLEPGRSYAMWLNEPPYENFQDQNGHKAVPYLLVFETRH
jgi:RNA polymerase sigma-70 factor (ECF subfamily)